MKYVILVSHGKFAEGLANALSMLVGKREDIIAVGLEDGKSVDEFTELFTKTVDKITTDDEVVLLGDLIGGSPLTNAIIRAINQVPGLRTASEGDAQAILETRIVEYERIPVASSSSDTALAASYNMRVCAECTLKRSNGDVIFKNRKVRAETLVYTSSFTDSTAAPRNDLIGNEYQNMPVLMRELGGKIKDAVIGIW